MSTICNFCSQGFSGVCMYGTSSKSTPKEQYCNKAKEKMELDNLINKKESIRKNRVLILNIRENAYNEQIINKELNEGWLVQEIYSSQYNLTVVLYKEEV